MLSKVKVLNIWFNTVTYEELISFLNDRKNRKGYICFPDLSIIIRANENKVLKNILNNSTLTLPDGTPSQLLIKKIKNKNGLNISGFWLCKKLLKTDLSHFFYGTTKKNLLKMEISIKNEFPNANILGYKSPPLINEKSIAHNNELHKEISNIFALKPSILWIGISSPKQDFLMKYFHSKNPDTIMIGVGAVFDYFAGTAFMGPEWVKKIGLRWLYQFFIDPKRYFPRMIYILRKLPKLLITGHL